MTLKMDIMLRKKVFDETVMARIVRSQMYCDARCSALALPKFKMKIALRILAKLEDAEEEHHAEGESV